MVRKIFLKEFTGLTVTAYDKFNDIIFYNKFSIFLRKLGRFIKRLITWLPLCWNQENWDIDYLYDLLEFKLKELLQAQQQDTWHCEKEVKRRVKQIQICLQYLDRYRNWPNYYEFPEPIFESRQDGKYGLVYSMKFKPGQRLKVDEAHKYEQFMYDMFWKRFMQWHKGWWT